MILACDVGGTKTDVALFEPVVTALRQVRRETFRSQDHRSLIEIVAAFIDLCSAPRLEAAGFTEVVVRLRRPPPIAGVPLVSNHVRFQLGPAFEIGLGATIREPGQEQGHALELLASQDHEGAETDPYAALLGDAMRGETFRFARQDYVEEAWRIVDPGAQVR
jgi:Glucose-6-phosphate dehydrogenase, C-terminal domain/Glucokinase